MLYENTVNYMENSETRSEDKHIFFRLQSVQNEPSTNRKPDAKKRFCQILTDIDINEADDTLPNNDSKEPKAKEAKRKTSISIKGKPVEFNSIEIDINEENKMDEVENSNEEKIIEKQDPNSVLQSNITSKFDGLIDKINSLGDELVYFEKSCVNKDVSSKNIDSQLVNSVCIKLDNASAIEHCGKYETPSFVDLDDLSEDKDLTTLEKSDQNNSTSKSCLNDINDDIISDEQRLSVTSNRRRSLSVGSKILPLQRSSSVESFESTGSSNKNFRPYLSQSCANIYEESFQSDSTESGSSQENTKRRSRPEKRQSFIGKSISVDLVIDDEGYFSSKHRRNGLNFDSSNSEDEQDFFSDLATFKANYNQQKKSGLRFARSVENLLKIDRSNDVSIRRKRSNTELKNPLPLQQASVSKKQKKKFRKDKVKDSKMIRETNILGERDENRLSNISVQQVQRVARFIEMYLDKNGDVIRKIEIQKVPGQSLGFFIRFGDGIEKEDGIFISRVTLGSFADVNNLLHAGDEILQINKIDVENASLEEVAEIMQKAESLIIKTRSALPLPLYAKPLLDSFFSVPEGKATNKNSKVLQDGHGNLQRTRSDPMVSKYDVNGANKGRSDSINLDENANEKKNYLAEPKQNKRNSKSPTFYRKLLKEVPIYEEENPTNFSRAQKYQLKPPTTVEQETPTFTKSGNKSFIRSPKLFRKKQNVEPSISLPVVGMAMQTNRRPSPSFFSKVDDLSSSDTDDSTDSTEYRIYDSDMTCTMGGQEKSKTGKLTIALQKLLNGSLVEGIKNCYFTIELDGEFGAKTEMKQVSDIVNINETFELELRNTKWVIIYIFGKSEKGQADKLLTDCCIQLSNLYRDDSDKSKHLILQTSTKLEIKVKFEFEAAQCFLQRSPSTKSRGIFGFNLSQTLAKEENTIPILVRKCVEEIEKRGLDLEGIYRISGNARKKRILRQRFEENSADVDVSDETEIDCHLLAGILKDYLRELPNPLISQDMYLNLYNKSRDTHNEHTKTRILMELMKKLPITNRATLIYLMEHLQKVINLKDVNKMDSKNLAVCFGPTMMCPPMTSSNLADMFDFKKQIQALDFLISIWPKKVVQNSV